MKKYLTLPFLLIATVTLAQPPQVEWAKCFGGGSDDKALSVVSTDDGGYIICGHTASNDGDVTSNKGGIDGWVVKTDNGGNIQWQKSYGGSNNDIFRSVLPVSGGRFVLCGETASNDSDITTLNHGLTDVWVAQIDGAGNLMWQNTYGGSNEDLGTDIIVADSGYFVVGQTFSDDGDIQSYKDSGDAWLIVIDSVGTLTDQKTKGGSSEDIFNEIKPTLFGGYIICGTTFSNDGSVNDLNHGGSDAWLIKLSKNGSAQWTYCYGNTGDDGGYRILQNADGSYVISGHYHDGTNQDSWLLGVDSNGIETASFAYGGDSTEIAGPILQDPLGAYVVGPSSSSPISGDLTCHLGETDIWLYSSSISSTLNWQQCLGGSGDEFSSESLLGSDSSIVIAGYTNSLDGNVSGNHGGFDFWLVKLASGCSALASYTYSVLGHTATFNNQSTNATSWFWDFGDGTTSTDENPVHTYSGIGTFTACLTASDAVCAPFTYCADVYICGLSVTTDFNFSIDEAIVTFNDQSTNANFWNWSFGDGTTSIDENPVHTYTTNGQFEICLVSGQEGCSSDTLCQEITLCAYPMVADFDYLGSDLSVSFFDASEGATIWAWTFGDGATSTDQNPTHLYAGTGTYEVCLIASDLCGTDTFCQTITVCLAPQADFSYFASSSSVINFIDESDDATSWFWDFGDGLTSTDANPVHEYVTGGNFEVCLVATNSCSSDTFCQTIIIECPPFEGAFSFTQSIDTAYFTDESPNAVSWLWDFGDGGSSVDQNPNHIYGADGTYTVCLTVSDGCTSDTTCSEIEVVGTSAGQLPNGEFFSVYPNPINGFAVVSFTLTSDSWISVTLNDISGRVMKNIAIGNYASGNYTNEFATGGLSEGIYFIQLKTEKGTAVQKVIIQD